MNLLDHIQESSTPGTPLCDHSRSYRLDSSFSHCKMTQIFQFAKSRNGLSRMQYRLIHRDLEIAKTTPNIYRLFSPPHTSFVSKQKEVPWSLYAYLAVSEDTFARNGKSHPGHFRLCLLWVCKQQEVHWHAYSQRVWRKRKELPLATLTYPPLLYTLCLLSVCSLLSCPTPKSSSSLFGVFPHNTR